MHRVEPVIKLLDESVVWSLLSFVKPDWYEGKKSKSLLCEKVVFAEKLNLIAVSAEQLHIDNIKKDKLTEEAPPFSAPEEIENKNGEYACVVVVHHTRKTYNKGGGNTADEGKYAKMKLTAFSCHFVKMYKKYACKEGEQNILVHIIKEITAHHKIKWYFTNEGKHSHSGYIFFQIFCVEIALNNHKSKNGEGESANTGHPLIACHNRCPHMVKQHKCHCKNVKGEACYLKIFKLAHLFTSLSSENSFQV